MNFWQSSGFGKNPSIVHSKSATSFSRTCCSGIDAVATTVARIARNSMIDGEGDGIDFLAGRECGGVRKMM